MDYNRPRQYSFREYPTQFIVMGLISAGGGIYLYQKSGELTVAAGIILAVSLLPFFFASILDVNADSTASTLSISRRGLFQRYRKEIPFSGITAIQLGTHYDNEDGSRTYRVEITLTDGSVVPLRKGYTSGRKKKEEQVQRLREIIGAGGADTPAAGILQSIAQMAAPQLRAEQESISGDQDEVHETDGVRWQLKTLTFGSSPISRWQSTDVALPDNFVYLTQKMKTQKQPSSNKLAQALYEKLFAQSLHIYGYRDMAAPYLSQADIYPVEARLADDFFAFASDAALTATIFTPWVTMPLADWANKHPFTKNNNEQLALFYAPQGLFLATLGTVNAEYLKELTALGVEIVRALGG